MKPPDCSSTKRKSRSRADAANYMTNMSEASWKASEGGKGKAKRDIGVPEGMPFLDR